MADEVVPGAGPVDGDGQGTAAAGPAVRAGRAGLAARRARRTTPGPSGSTPPCRCRAEELHQTGLDQVAELEARAVEVGAGLGLSGRDEVFGALRDSAGKISAEEAMRQAVAAVRRAEARAGELFPAPLPPPCEVTPMPEVVAVSGAAPHYTPPRLDGGRAGTFWFNTARPTAGDRLGHRGGGLPRGGARAPPPAVPAAAAHRPARAAAPAQPVGVLRGVGPVRGAARRGSRAVRRRPRPARRDQRVADAGGPAGGGHRPARVRLEPRAGPGVHGRARPHAAGVHGRRRSTGTS